VKLSNKNNWDKKYDFVFPLNLTFECYQYYPNVSKHNNKQIINTIGIQVNTINELNDGLLLDLKEEEKHGLRYRLRVNIIDSNENSLISIQPIMLRDNGMVNDSLPRHLRTLYVALKHEIDGDQGNLNDDDRKNSNDEDQENSNDDNDNLH
jgi:hypothetical protein